MKSRIALGAGAGLAGGLIAAFILWILGIKGHEGQIASPITLLSHLVGSSNLAAGGLVLIVVGTAVGALFGVLYPASGRAPSAGRRSARRSWASRRAPPVVGPRSSSLRRDRTG